MKTVNTLAFAGPFRSHAPPMINKGAIAMIGQDQGAYHYTTRESVSVGGEVTSLILPLAQNPHTSVSKSPI